jgi:2-desacetyl-2-hydroxyethyl bacteriochlorophyllide A dehydrogenase
MKALGLVSYDDQNFSLETIELPDPGPRELLVRTLFSGVSVGTEFALIRKKISWGPFPLVTGYMSTGIVEGIGSKITDFMVGDSVYLRNNSSAMRLANGGKVSAVSGLHSSHAITSVDGSHGAALLPEDVAPDVASQFVLPSVGYHGVDMAGAKMGETVLVYGSGSIGLGVIAASFLRGCKVIAVDRVPSALNLAREFGAETIINTAENNLSTVMKGFAPEGADLVFECTGIPSLIDEAISLTRPGGKFIWQGNYGESPLNFSFLIPHQKQLQTFFPCDDGYAPCRRAVLSHIAQGVLPWEKTLTHKIPYTKAPAFFAGILNNTIKTNGAIIDWGNPS